MIRSVYIDEQGNLSHEITTADMRKILDGKQGTLWVDMESPRQMEAVPLLSEVFKFHPLAIEDCFHPLQYSRVDSYREYLFVVAHGIKTGIAAKVETVELDFFLGVNYVVTFRSEPMPIIDTIHEVMIKDTRKFQRGADWLAHTIIDLLVDGYLPVTNEISDRLDHLEGEAMEHPTRSTLIQILSTKRDIQVVHRAAVPLRELISRLSREDFETIRNGTRLYFRDVYDHLVRIAETTEILREVSEGAMTMYAMSQNNRVNDIIKGLTVVATLSLPMLIISSIYGMNFAHMPEIHWRFGYMYALLTGAGISLALLVLLRFKKWL